MRQQSNKVVSHKALDPSELMSAANAMDLNGDNEVFGESKLDSDSDDERAGTTWEDADKLFELGHDANEHGSDQTANFGAFMAGSDASYGRPRPHHVVPLTPTYENRESQIPESKTVSLEKQDTPKIQTPKTDKEIERIVSNKVFGNRTRLEHFRGDLGKTKARMRAIELEQGFLFNPHSENMKHWDGAMVFFLIYVAFVTPYTGTNFRAMSFASTQLIILLSLVPTVSQSRHCHCHCSVYDDQAVRSVIGSLHDRQIR
jgi:hypothetical protein